MKIHINTLRFIDRHGSLAVPQAVGHESMGSITGQSVWDLWWRKWHLDRLFSAYFGFPLSVSFC
jgi:hypothetical protein